MAGSTHLSVSGGALLGPGVPSMAVSPPWLTNWLWPLALLSAGAVVWGPHGFSMWPLFRTGLGFLQHAGRRCPDFLKHRLQIGTA